MDAQKGPKVSFRSHVCKFWDVAMVFLPRSLALPTRDIYQAGSQVATLSNTENVTPPSAYRPFLANDLIAQL